MAIINPYEEQLVERFWKYRRAKFKGRDDLFHRAGRKALRAPVFTEENADQNLLFAPQDSVRDAMIATIPARERHIWFRSMKSSQAVAQSVFGNLIALNKLYLLEGLKDEDGLNVFGPGPLTANNCSLEYEVHYLGEPRPTSVDVFLDGPYRVAVECKLTESEVGSCSRPRMTSKDRNYEQEFCDGSYSLQRGRNKRCSLSERDIQYWKYIPEILSWPSDQDHSPCPLHRSYQIVRNVLAALVTNDGELSPQNGHAVLLYDSRNPAFEEGGEGMKEWQKVRSALNDPTRLRRISWQILVQHLKEDNELHWLVEGLEEKYGL